MNASTSKSTKESSAAPQPTADRITVALTQKAAEELQKVRERSRLSKTDIVNRAIALYEFCDEQHRLGNDLLVRNTKTGETLLIQLLLFRPGTVSKTLVD